jgi:hypothetical protein
MQYFKRVKLKFERRTESAICQKEDPTIVRTALTEGGSTGLFVILHLQHK